MSTNGPILYNIEGIFDPSGRNLLDQGEFENAFDYDWFVDSVNGDDAFSGKSPSHAFRTLTKAKDSCAADDYIAVADNFALTVSAAAGQVWDKAGVTIVGFGVGDRKPTVTFGTSTSASFDITADNVKLLNFIGLAAIDGLTKPFNVTGDGFVGNLEWHDASSTVEAATALRLDTADNFDVRLKYRGFVAGNATTSAVLLDGVSNGKLDVDFYGIVSTAVVNMVDVLSTNIAVTGRMYTSGVTNYSRLVVDTITGSIWTAVVLDATAGAEVIGSNVAAFAAATPGAVAAAVAAVAADLGDVADAALADTIEGAAASTQTSITDIKGILQRIGADNGNNTAATTLVAANRDGSVLERQESIISTLFAEASSSFVPGLGFRVIKTEDLNVAVGDNLFDVTGKVLITLWTGEVVTNTVSAAVVDYKIALTTNNADLCAAGDISLSVPGHMFMLNSDAGDTSLSSSSYAVTDTGSADSNGKGLANRVVGLASLAAEVIKSVRTAGAAGDAIRHTIYYLPLETGATVAASA